MTILNFDQLISASANTGQILPWLKFNTTTRGAGTFTDFFHVLGMPGSASAPASSSTGGTHYTRTDKKGIYFNTGATNTNNYVTSFSVAGTQQGVFYLVDRLWGCSGLATASNATSSITGMSNITRYNGGEGCEIAYVCLSSSTGPASYNTASMSLSVIYTNTDSVANRTGTISFYGAAPPISNQMFFCTLQTGDVGVKSVQKVINNSIGFTGGQHGLVVLKKLMCAPLSAPNYGLIIDGLRTGLQEIDKNSCLNFIVLNSTSGSGQWSGTLNIVTG